MPNGKGILKKAYGEQCQGFFKDGKLYGFITKISSTGVHKWEGEYLEDKKNGLFRQYFHDKLLFE